MAGRTRRSIGIAGILAAGMMISACQPVTPTPTSSLTPAPLDFTEPGAARAMVERLLVKAGSSRPVLVQVSAQNVVVSVLNGTTAKTWAYRGGELAEIPSDLAYVDQATFDTADFNFSDIGALFRAAAGASGSEASQMLQIVDYSGGDVMMAVSTNPESRTVFFEPDGSLLPLLDFQTAGGVRTGLDDVTRDLGEVTALKIDSAIGASSDHAGTGDTVVHRLRTSKVPTTTTIRQETPPEGGFSPSLVRPEVIWEVLQRVRAEQRLSADSAWSVTVAPSSTGTPRMSFTVGATSLVTTLAGAEVSS